MKKGNQGDGGGRPVVELTAEQVIELRALAAVLNKSQVADYFGISENTLRAIEKRQPEVSAAYKKGRVNQIAGMGSNLIQLAKAGNVTANIFYLKTQAGWKEAEPESKEIPPINIIVDGNATNSSSE
ncbi:MAG: hypothetical protein HOM38_09235 [Euryarchaeota archaeon]|jgi:hypothetical protein|nr:hypothetical protein [Euryarchaeota archaeon]